MTLTKDYIFALLNYLLEGKLHLSKCTLQFRAARVYTYRRECDRCVEIDNACGGGMARSRALSAFADSKRLVRWNMSSKSVGRF